MDPQVAWEEMLAAIAESDFSEAELKAEYLIDWLDNNGFPPQTVSRVLAKEWDQMICRNVCRKVMMVVKTPEG